MGDAARLNAKIGLPHFLQTYSGMRVRPSSGRKVLLVGEFAFSADYEECPVIEDVYELAINISERFPDDLPMIVETGGRIPRDVDHHVFPNGALCLGSPLRLHEITVTTPDLTSYVESALVPYLYAISYWEKTGERFLFGELDHDAMGLVDDYSSILDLHDSKGVVTALRLLGTKRRKANKCPCPCECGNRLGVCRFNETIRNLRDRHGRPYFKQLYHQFLQHVS